MWRLNVDLAFREMENSSKPVEGRRHFLSLCEVHFSFIANSIAHSTYESIQHQLGTILNDRAITWKKRSDRSRVRILDQGLDSQTNRLVLTWRVDMAKIVDQVS